MRVAIVTGAAQGIGRCGAQTLAERGHDLALDDLRSPSETLAMVQQSGAAAIELVGDISDETVSLPLRRWSRRSGGGLICS